MSEQFTSIARPLNLEAMGGHNQKIELKQGDQCIDLEKGAISDAFDSSTFSSYVQGAIVKAGLSNTLKKVNAAYSAAEAEVKKQVAECKKQGLGDPDCLPEFWTTRGYDVQMDDLPKVYSMKSIREANPTFDLSTDSNCFYQHNQAVRNYIDKCVDKLVLESLHSTIQDSRDYYLSPRQMVLIGIK